jgi:hypothetical protein
MLNESGNIFKDKKTGEVFTKRINREDVEPTLRWLEGKLGLDLVSNTLGTTGRKATSGDLDIAVDEETISKEELMSKLLGIEGATKDDVKKGGINVHFKTPINGDSANGFVQTDFMFGKPSWLKFSMQGGVENSEYSGKHKHVLLASIAKATKPSEFPEGLKWSYTEGLVDRASNESISKNPKEIAKILLGKSFDESDLSNVETIVSAIRDRSDFDELVRDANETFATNKSFAAPPITKLLKEALEARIQHPEDMVYWEGSEGAQKAVNGLLELAENATSTTTIKWDGSPAIVFGVDKEGKFILTDKGGFTVKSYKGRTESPEELESMIKARGEKQGKDYSQFASDMRNIFVPFKQALKEINKQPDEGVFFKGDLLYMSKPKIVGKEYEFKPNVVTYKVPVKTELGEKINQSNVGVVLHGIIREDSKGNVVEESLEELTGYFNGNLSSGGLLAGTLLIFSPVFVNETPKFEMDMVEQAEKLQSKVEASAAKIDSIFQEQELTEKKIKDLPDVLYSYANASAGKFSSISADDFSNWIKSNPKLSKQKVSNLLTYVSEKSSEFTRLFEIVKSIEELKNKIVSQFDEQNTAVKSFIGDSAGGEGYVTKSSHGLFKLVRRGGGFSVAHAKQYVKEAVKVTKIGYYPGSFKPFHRGHYESILAAKDKVNELNVIASASDRVRPGEFPLSGQASKEYLEKYIKPALQEKGINLIVSTGSPVSDVYNLAKEQANKNAYVYLFAGPDDLERFSPESIKKNFPELSEKRRIKVEPTTVIMGGDGEERISGTATRQALENDDINGFKALLPNIPAVQKDAKKIMLMFKKAGEKIAEEKAAKEAAKKTKTVKKKTAKESVLYECIMLLVKEQIILEKKKRKGKIHFPKKIEKIIKTELKPRYGDNDAAIYGTATKIMKAMGLKKTSKKD